MVCLLGRAPDRNLRLYPDCGFPANRQPEQDALAKGLDRRLRALATATVVREESAAETSARERMETVMLCTRRGKARALRRAMEPPLLHPSQWRSVK